MTNVEAVCVFIEAIMIAITAISNGVLKLWRPTVQLSMLGLLEVHQQAA